MEKPKGLVSRILHKAEDAGGDPAQKVQRKKITLDQLQQVIAGYVKATAGMGDPELRSTIVNLEIQNSTLKQQCASLQKSVDSARAGWKQAQDDLAALSREREGDAGGLKEELASARGEADAFREECSRLKGKLAAMQMETSESLDQAQALKLKTEQFAARLDESKRNEKKLKQEVLELATRIKTMAEERRLETEKFEARLEELEAGFDHVRLLPALSPEKAIERAKELGARASELSVGEEPRITAALEQVEKRCTGLRLELEAARDEMNARLADMEKGLAGFEEIGRIVEIHGRFRDTEEELRDLDRLIGSLKPPGKER